MVVMIVVALLRSRPNRCNPIPPTNLSAPALFSLIFTNFLLKLLKVFLALFLLSLHYPAVMLSGLVFLDFQRAARNHQTS